ncbi:MAG: S8 family serine peptidase [Nannocystaceae bacterium]
MLDDLADASASPATASPHHTHGGRVVGVVEESACAGEASCPVRVVTHSALPRFDDPGAVADGPGKFGTRDDLADAILRALRSWEREREARHLVLNLSIGWEPSTGCTEEELPDDVQRVRRALHVASCAGALVVASTGNQRLPRWEVEGPLCPALWESASRPDPATCSRLLAEAGLEPRGSPGGAGDDGPLLVAVSGVGRDGALLSQARPSSRSALVSWGEATDADGVVRRGTSFAAARVSGLAAAIWARQPEWSAGEVVRFLYEHGEPTGASSDFGADAPRPSHLIDRRVLGSSRCEE